MAFPRKRRAAFTLTEMLIAAGILGIGLTMVASIFPVAIDQSRRSRDQTMAALCARSVLAQARADRNATYSGLRGQTEDCPEIPSNTPDFFQNEHYVARLFASPTGISGPWRIAIFVCRSIGSGATNDSWADATDPTPPDPEAAFIPPPGPGTYVVEKWRGGAIGHLVDYVQTDQAGNKTGYFAIGVNSRNETEIPPAADKIQCVPDAIAVFHTILGE